MLFQSLFYRFYDSLYNEIPREVMRNMGMWILQEIMRQKELCPSMGYTKKWNVIVYKTLKQVLDSGLNNIHRI